jgi:two-component sensor histidine kinase
MIAKQATEGREPGGVSSASAESLLLLEELTHRITNEFTAAAYLVSFAALNCANERDKFLLNDIYERLKGFAGVHRALQAPVEDTVIDATAYLRGLCREIGVSKLIPRGIQLVVLGSPVNLQSLVCWCLGLVVSELVNNSIRHAFQRAHGTIWVGLQHVGPTITCTVEDDGMADPAPVTGRGYRIVRALADRIGAVVHRKFSARGSRCTLTFPMESDFKTWGIGLRGHP